MITEGFLRRHTAAYGGNREVALLDVAQEYVLEYLRREGVFADLLIFKGGTALRKYVFGSDGRFSIDLDFSLREETSSDADIVLDLLDGGSLGGVTFRLERRKGPAALLKIETPLGPVTIPAAVSIRERTPWLPPEHRTPMPFEFLDRGLEPEFARSPLPILDPREIAAEKVAAFWRRRKARDLYDLDHLGRVLQADFDGPNIARLAALKIYFDVVEDGLGRPLTAPTDIFGIPTRAVTGTDDLGLLRAARTNITDLLTRCAQRYDALTALEETVVNLVATCSKRDQRVAIQLRQETTERLIDPM